MRRLSIRKTPIAKESTIGIFILILIITLISVNASYAQTDRPEEREKEFRTNSLTFTHITRDQSGAREDCNRLPNRSIDGSCNNILNDGTAEWGAADIALFREMAAHYGSPDFNNDMGGSERPSARAVSNIISDQTLDLPSPRNLSSLVFTWGQFIDHDFSLTPEGHTEYEPILLPADEPLFTAPIPFFRSAPLAGSGVTTEREQQNLITSWLDGSQVYGSEDSRAAWLRTFSGGRLKTSAGNLLPYNTIDGQQNSAIDPTAPSMAGDASGTAKVFVAGDVRANEQPGLTALHTLFVREHNRICDRFVQQGSGNDEQNYQRARKIIGGYIQHITYQDFLPALGVNVPQYNGYRSNVQPDISNLFASAAYRLGHTMVTEEIPIINNNCQPIDGGSIALLDGFFNPAVVANYGIEPLLQGLASQTQQKVDAKIVDNLRNFLFPVPGADPFGLDLGSLNIQRGRDHGLPSYYAARAFYTNDVITDFADITADANLQLALKTAFGNIYNIDLWVGLLAEDPLSSSSLGPTLTAILSEQFAHIRDGDFYYYQNDPTISNQQRDQIRNTSLQRIIERNTDIDQLQNNVFFASDCDDNGGGGGGGGGGQGNGGGPGGGGPGNGGPGAGNNGQERFDNSIEPNINAELSIYPNPSRGQFNITLQLKSAEQNVEIIVEDVKGKKVFREKLVSSDASFVHALNLENLSPGMYFLTLKTKGYTASKRLILNNGN